MFQFFYILWENYELYLYVINPIVEWDRGKNNDSIRW